MKTTRLISSALLLFSLHISSTISQTINPDSFNSLSKGHISIQFGIGQNLTIGALSGYALSGKYNISNRIAIRVGFAVSYKKNEGTVSRDSITRENVDNTNGFTIDPVLIFYINRNSQLTFFFGAGPLYSFSHSHTKTTESFHDIYDYSTDSWETGGKVMLGCEWFIMKRISFFADYEASFTAGHQKSSRQYYDLNYGTVAYSSGEMDMTTFRASTSRFGLSVYF